MRHLPGFCLSFLSLAICAAGGVHAQTATPGAEAGLLRTLIPGENFLSPVLRAQQADDFDNPAYPFVEAGEISWSRVEGAAGKSCQDCHGGGPKNTLKRAAATYPKYSPDVKQVITLQRRVNLCRQNNMLAPPLPLNSEQMLAVTAYLRWLSRGVPAQAIVSGPAAAVFERGRLLYQTKTGLFQLSCVQCHSDRFGQTYGSQTLSQGHALAYPVFNIGLNRMVSLHERFRMCNQLARAEGQPDDAADYIALELYLNWRSKELPVTAPGVRP